MLNTGLLSITRGINYLKVLSLVVVLWYTLIFNIERVDRNDESLINLSNDLYLTVIIIGIAILAFPNLGQMRFPIVYIGFLLFIQGNHIISSWHPLSIDILLTEAAIIGITLFLMRHLSLHLQNVEEGLHQVVLADETAHVLSYEEAIKQSTEELHELGQLNRPMSVIYCTLSSDDSSFLNLTTAEEILNWNMQQMFEVRTRQVDLGRRIMALTRVGDIIFEHRNGIIACLVEIDREEAEQFLYRLYHFVNHQEWTLWAGIAMYPDDAENIEDLLKIATNTLQVYERENVDDELNEGYFTGDVRVGMQKRLEIERSSTWVSQMAYQSPTARTIYRPAKRLMDIMVSGGLLLALSPLFLVIATLIYLNDKRPIFFTQERVGRGGKSFKMYKFRSMYRNAPALEPVLVELPDGSVRMDWPEKVENDPRIIPIGRSLRKWSIDELPQLWNVFRGHMSLIGPRPSSWALEKHTLLQTSRLTVKPGITGLWQVSARDSKNFDERVLWDMKYAQKMGLWLDFQILLRTFMAVIRKTGS